jgi:hypothetical protein
VLGILFLLVRQFLADASLTAGLGASKSQNIALVAVICPINALDGAEIRCKTSPLQLGTKPSRPCGPRLRTSAFRRKLRAVALNSFQVKLFLINTVSIWRDQNDCE